MRDDGGGSSQLDYGAIDGSAHSDFLNILRERLGADLDDEVVDRILDARNRMLATLEGAHRALPEGQEGADRRAELEEDARQAIRDYATELARLLTPDQYQALMGIPPSVDPTIDLLGR